MKEIFDYILSLFKSRIFPLIMVFIVLVGVLVNRLFSLQIINGESYVKDLSSSIQKDMSVAATRGRIFDKNGVLLAYNDLAYAVRISDSGKYEDNDTKTDICECVLARKDGSQNGYLFNKGYRDDRQGFGCKRGACSLVAGDHEQQKDGE